MLYFLSFCAKVLLFVTRILQRRIGCKKQSLFVLNQIERSLNGSFDQLTFNKIVKSYSIYLPIVNDAFASLHGRTTNESEQLKSIHYFICSSLFDNFWDDKTYTQNQIEAFTFNPYQYSPQTFDERAYLQSHIFLLDQIKDKDSYFSVLRKESDAQAASMQQFNKTITNEMIQNITFDKGGNAVLLCRYYLEVIPTKEEENCWYVLGKIIQLTNDLFDIYKDIQHDMQTLATRCNNAYTMEVFFLHQIEFMKYNISQLPYTKQKKFFFSLSMAACYCFGLIAIKQLKKIQGSEGSLPDFKTLPRKALIVDMEKISNIWLWIKLIYKHARV